MAIYYDRLWELLIDKKMMKKDFASQTGFSMNAIANTGKGKDVSTKVLRKICETLNCQIEDIIEIEYIKVDSDP